MTAAYWKADEYLVDMPHGPVRLGRVIARTPEPGRYNRRGCITAPQFVAVIEVGELVGRAPVRKARSTAAEARIHVERIVRGLGLKGAANDAADDLPDDATEADVNRVILAAQVAKRIGG